MRFQTSYYFWILCVETFRGIICLRETATSGQCLWEITTSIIRDRKERLP